MCPRSWSSLPLQIFSERGGKCCCNHRRALRAVDVGSQQRILGRVRHKKGITCPTNRVGAANPLLKVLHPNRRLGNLQCRKMRRPLNVNQRSATSARLQHRQLMEAQIQTVPLSRATGIAVGVVVSLRAIRRRTINRRTKNEATVTKPRETVAGNVADVVEAVAVAVTRRTRATSR